MSCEKYLDLISARMDGETTLLEESELSAHLRSCSRCRAIAEDLNGIRSEMIRMEPAPVPEDFTSQVMDRVRLEQTQQRNASRQRRRTLRRLSGLAACLALCIGVVRLTGLPAGFGGLTAVGEAARSMARKADHLAPAAVSAVEATTLPAGDDGVSVPAEGTTDPAPAKEPAHYFFCNDQYVRVYGKTPEAPSACILGSVQSLTGFVSRFDDDLSALTERYNEEYFKTGRLLAVVVEEPSGSNRLQLASQGLLDDSVTVIRRVPEAGTCDMASWLILAEVDTMFNDDEILQVKLVKQELIIK